jgi:uncharacterized protein (DUF983 family)
VANRVLQLVDNGLRLKCPRCGVGALYEKPFRMYPDCPHCGLKFEKEQGYFVGAIYVNYAATVLLAVPGFFVLDAFTNITITQQLSIWIPFSIIFPLLFFHHSRSLWLALDHLLNPAKMLYSVPPKNPTNFSSGSK